jgi:hypothetical protein
MAITTEHHVRCQFQGLRPPATIGRGIIPRLLLWMRGLEERSSELTSTCTAMNHMYLLSWFKCAVRGCYLSPKLVAFPSLNNRGRSCCYQSTMCGCLEMPRL